MDQQNTDEEARGEKHKDLSQQISIKIHEDIKAEIELDRDDGDDYDYDYENRN
ncbi:MAG TPA: hypothetical protein VEB40_04905 [Flavipsychrobacter sp.]|nr:hypothetical protein [Flavipsychrobacter sp.]